MVGMAQGTVADEAASIPVHSGDEAVNKSSVNRASSAGGSRSEMDGRELENCIKTRERAKLFDSLASPPCGDKAPSLKINKGNSCRSPFRRKMGRPYGNHCERSAAAIAKDFLQTENLFEKTDTKDSEKQLKAIVEKETTPSGTEPCLGFEQALARPAGGGLAGEDCLGETEEECAPSGPFRSTEKVRRQLHRFQKPLQDYMKDVVILDAAT